VTNLSLENFEENLQKRINSLLNSYLNSNSQIEKAIKFSLSAPGKRVRPILIYLVGDIYDISLEKLDSLALASEIIHTYSLVHDDLPCMDDDDLRRGQPTLHKKYSEATAVLAGDAMQSLAIQIILEDEILSNELKVSTLKLLMESIGYKGMILGQEQDISFEQKSVNKEEIIQMNYLKTGLLIEFCIMAPLIIANKKEDEWNTIARNVGIAFQLIDDLLDLEESEENLGKASNKDQSKNKKNLPLTLGRSETVIELKRFHYETMESFSKLSLNNHPLKIYIDNLFNRRS
jgi:geranylgeranyl pyrophosphate synthase